MWQKSFFTLTCPGSTQKELEGKLWGIKDRKKRNLLGDKKEEGKDRGMEEGRKGGEGRKGRKVGGPGTRWTDQGNTPINQSAPTFHSLYNYELINVWMHLLCLYHHDSKVSPKSYLSSLGWGPNQTQEPFEERILYNKIIISLFLWLWKS